MSEVAPRQDLIRGATAALAEVRTHCNQARYALQLCVDTDPVNLEEHLRTAQVDVAEALSKLAVYFRNHDAIKRLRTEAPS